MPGLHIRNPLHAERDPSQPMPPQRLSKKVKRAKKEAKKAKKEAAKAKKLALKAKSKAEKIESEAMSVRLMVQKAQDMKSLALKDMDTAQDARVRSMRWATSVGNTSQGLREQSKDVVAEAKMIYKQADYCDHSLL